ncbi:hypothetical protein BCR44DRAFT_1437160 [Catenaria anguillulae PL171]|uniref:Uncharacterized protein n=1 Tax=Catenaria anguillulae PL171 TaxID=765915 RepID=A0A1Y2HHQ2_9FUNG|nr:hypothetical protein BCR44DRAFT_1437160 [Catenaria anguillulae PL171]
MVTNQHEPLANKEIKRLTRTRHNHHASSTVPDAPFHMHQSVKSRVPSLNASLAMIRVPIMMLTHGGSAAGAVEEAAETTTSRSCSQPHAVVNQADQRP